MPRRKGSLKRTERLFAITEYLRGRRTGVTAERLAERFEVSPRTIYRDLDSLRAAHLPVQADRGRGGGYALARSYALPPVNFTAQQAAVLIRGAEWLAQSRVMPFVDTIASACDKVRGALAKSEQRALLDRLSSLVFVGVPARAVNRQVRDALERAWFEQRPLRLLYRTGGCLAEQASARTVRVEQIVMERTTTLLNCFDLDKQQKRQLRLDRIVWAEVVRHVVE